MILVTGASGAIGAWLVLRLLENKQDVVSILHDQRPCTTADLLGVTDRIAWAKGSILDAEFVKRVIADYNVTEIYHLAALPLVQVSTRTTTPIFETNIIGTVNILEAIKENLYAGKEIKFLYMSTDKAYGDAGETPYREDMRLGGLSIYDVSKSCADLIVSTYQTSKLISHAVTARPCNAVIPGDIHNMGRVLPRLVLPLMHGRTPQLYRTAYLREFIWIEDLVDALIKLMQAGETGAFNIGSGYQATIDDLVELVLAYFGGGTVEWVAAPSFSRVEIPFQKLSTDKIQTKLGWKAQVSLESAVSRYIQWWEWNLWKVPNPQVVVEGWHG